MQAGPGSSARPIDEEHAYVDRFVHDLPDAAVAVDGDGRIVAANELIHVLLGHPAQDLLGQSVEVLVPTPFHDQHVSWRHSFQDRPTARPMGGGMILDARCFDGSELAVEVSLAPLGGRTTVAIVHDRSETVRARQALQDRLEVEMLAVEISSNLAGASGMELEGCLDDAVGRACRLIGADQGFLYANSADGTCLELANEWCVDGLDPTPGRIVTLPRGPFGWSGPTLQLGESVYIADRASLPPEADAEASFMAEHGILSALTIPLGSREEYKGTLALRWRRHASTWDPSRGDLLHLLGNVFLAAHRRRQAEAIRDASEHRHRLLVDTLAAGVVLIRRVDGEIVSANPAAAEILGTDRDQLTGTRILSPDVGLLDGMGARLPVARRRALLDAEHGGLEGEFGFERPNGDVIWVEVRAVELALGDEDHLATSFIDVTDRRGAEEQLRSRALHDPLTGLANRLLFGEHARGALARAERNGTTAAFLFLDLDHFKRINDRFGHSIGDELLKHIGGRIAHELRAVDVLGRIGGDEFVVVLADLHDASEAEVLARRIQVALATPIVIDGNAHVVSASIGLASVAGGDAAAHTVDEMLRRADQAMYAAKQAGRGRWLAWSDALVSAAHRRDEIEVELHQSLLAEHFELRFQPIFDVVGGHVVGAEALVRWRHPHRGLLEPSEFLDVAEETGLIVPLGQWVLEHACATAAAWPEPLWVSVNLSARQIGSNNAAGRVREVLEHSGLSPARLHLELTETALIEGSHSALRDLDEIHALGVQIGLDDFGTGYSSMTYLHTLPLSFLKIDRSFVGDLDHADGHRASTIVDMVLRLAESFGLEVIAEGVETTPQLSRLRALGCRFVQGFLYDVPLTTSQLDRRFGTTRYRS